MDYQYVLGGILACSLALVFVLYNFAEKRKAATGTGSSSKHVKGNGCVKTSENGICSQEGAGATDIIIVGAGVAGAALAYTLGKPVASTINTLAGALYKVFCASPDPARKEMRQACFDYLSLGSVFSDGPISLLSGLNPRPLSLVLHFFAVAIYGVGRLLIPFPSPNKMWFGARLISCASGIIFPIIKAEGVRQMFFPTTVPAYYRAPPVH